MKKTKVTHTDLKHILVLEFMKSDEIFKVAESKTASQRILI